MCGLTRALGARHVARMTNALPLSPQVFVILAGIIEDRTGLHYDLASCDLLAERVTPRALERGFDSLLDYYYFLRYDPGADAEFALLAEALVVNETYFFREAAALRVVVEVFVTRLLERDARPRIWCAACSTGEEPLTLAMLLDEAGLLDRVSIVASDISMRVLTHAKAGRYVRRSLRALPPGVIDRWLLPDGDGMRVAPRIAQAVSWHCVNLMDEAKLAALGQFDVVVCRNVLIYFRDQTVERVIANLWQSLLPDGHLVVGASESLLRFETPLECEEQRGAFFYRKVVK